MKIDEYMTKNRILFFVVLLVFISLSILPVMRFVLDKPLVIGEKPYYDARITETILEKGLIFNDEQILGGRDYAITPYHLLLLPFFYLLGSEISLIILPWVCGLFSVLLVFGILRKLKFSLPKIFFIFLVLLLSPTFTFTFSTPNEICVSIMLILIGLYFFIKSDNIFIPLFVFLVASLLNVINIFLVMFLLLHTSGVYTNKKNNSKLIIIIAFIVSLIYYMPIYFSSGFFYKIHILGINSIMILVSDLGSLIGMSIFSFVLGVIGLLLIWQDKSYFKHIYTVLSALIILSFYFDYASIYVSFIFSVFAGLSLNKIIHLKWELEFLKQFTALLLVFGLIFSAISYDKRIVYSEPSKDIKKALTWLEDVPGNDLVFSYYKKGFWVEYWSDKQVLTDSLFDFKDPITKFDESEELLHSRDIVKTKKLLDKYKIKYIFIDNDMKNGEVWNKKEGLWYLLGNNETFKNIYSRKGIEIWEYTLYTK